MEQLTTLDAGFLMAEDSDRHVSLAIGGLAILDGPAPDHDRITAVLAERLRAIPRCTQILRTHRLDREAPQWVEHPGFDLSAHVRRVAVPRPGDDTALFRVVADVMERRLDRSRPLWECWLIEGLPADRWAVLMKVHHCMADGVSATHLLTGLCDQAAGPAAAGGPGAAPAPTEPRPVRQRSPLTWVPGAWRAASATVDAATRAITGATEIAAGLLRPAAPSSLVGPVTAMRRYRAVQVGLADIQHVCRRFDVTVNDVVLAAITEGFRSVLLHRGEHPRADSLRTLVPVSTRPADALGSLDNRISLMLPYLPVEQDDPLHQLRTVHTRLRRTKHGGQRQAGKVLVSAANAVPFMVSSWAIRLLTRLPQRGVVTLATNVPGPRHRLAILGRPVVGVLPIPPIALGLRTGVAVLSYADNLVFGITADYGAITDVGVLADGIERAVARLAALSREGAVLLLPDDRPAARTA